MRAILLSHTEASRKLHPAGIGEMVHAAKLQKLVGHEIVDVYELFGEEYESLATLNYALADHGAPLLRGCTQPFVQTVQQKILRRAPDVLMMLSSMRSMSALVATGLPQRVPTIGKLYAFHEDERIITSLYDESPLLVTESLLANQKGVEAGIPPWRMVYLPHHYPEEIDKVCPAPHYVERPRKESVVIGMVSRLEPRKNCGFAFNAVAKLAEAGYDVLLVYKGSLDGPPPDLSLLEAQSWFVWDPKPTPFPEVLSEYAHFDIFLHLSGCEGASNVVVEMMALGKPCVVLDATTNRSLFQGGAVMVPHDGTMRPGPLPYRVPDEERLFVTLEALVKDKKLRDEWGARAKGWAKRCFDPSLTQERFPRILQGAICEDRSLSTLYEEDIKRHAY